MKKLQLFKIWKIMLITVSVNLFSLALLAQTIALHGRVVDETGEALIGATVKIPGTTTATTTNISGNFTLNVPAGTSKLSISFIGYQNYEKELTKGSTNLGSIALTKNSKNLNEVVVVGYGSLRRQDVTGTVATVDNKSLKEVPSANVFEQLKGKVAGLDVVSGTNGPAITIRGNRTIGNPAADGPLIVLDGEPFYNFIENIDPNNIRSIDVLKGASATAIYGSRGSGGVILITTFRGRIGQTITSYDSYYGISKLEGKLKVLNGVQYAQLKQDAIAGSILQNNGAAPLYALTTAEQAGLAAGVNTDWVDLLIKPAMIWDQSLRVSSGTENTQILVGAGYRKQTGLEPNIKNDRFSLDINVDHRMSKVIKFGVSQSLTLRTSDNGGANQIGTAQFMTPLATPYNADGSFNYLPYAGSNDATTLSPLAPGFIPTSYYNHTRGYVSNSILYAELSPIEHLKYRYTFNYNFSQSLQGQYNGINGGGILTTLNTNARTDNNYSYRLNQEHLLTYDNTFGKHHINLIAGFNAEKSHSENSNVTATNIPSDANLNTNLSLGTFQTDGGSYSETGLLSYFARVNYAFNNKYDLTGTIRKDGNSPLAQGHQWTTYPSLGLGWVISNESFMKNYTVVDNLKLRGGYGQTSTTGSVNAYSTLGQLSSVKYQYGGLSSGNSAGVIVNNLVNNNLTWQTTSEYNLALDFGLLKSRLTGSVEIYQQKTTGIILPNALPATNGAPSQVSNLGSSSDKGLEISLSSINIQSKGGFSWSTDFNIAFVREKILELPNGLPFIISSGEFVGQPLSVIYDLKKVGIWQISDSPGIDATKTPAGQVYLPVRGQTTPLQYPGQIHVEDLNGDGKIDAGDNQVIGHFNPNYIFGFTNRFVYKNFDLNIVIQGRMGFTTTVPYVSSSNSGTQGWQFLNLGRHNQPVIDYWTPSNPTNAFPGPNDQFQSLYYATLQYYDGSFIRAKSINFGYNVPANLVKHIGLSSLRLYSNITNPFIIYAPIMHHSFSVTDPESVGGINPVSAASSGNVGGYDANNNPNGWRGVGINAGEQTRDFIIGINARF
ncbi:SusC/RagA family TonB-linked outer membrane protein [Mucilaginibacter sp. AW1-3]